MTAYRAAHPCCGGPNHTAATCPVTALSYGKTQQDPGALRTVPTAALPGKREHLPAARAAAQEHLCNPSRGPPAPRLDLAFQACLQSKGCRKRTRRGELVDKPL